MKCDLPTLKGSKILYKSFVSHAIDGSEKALFLGVYYKDSFSDREEFCRFTQDISSITQRWYQYNDVKAAYEDYYSEENTEYWFMKAGRHTGRVREWAKSLGESIFHLDTIPQELEGEFYHYGDSEEFGAIGEATGYYFDLFIADYF